MTGYQIEENLQLLLFIFIVIIGVFMVWRLLSRNNSNNFVKALVVICGMIFVIYQVDAYSNLLPIKNDVNHLTTEQLAVSALRTEVELKNELFDRKVNKYNDQFNTLLKRIDYLNDKVDQHMTPTSTKGKFEEKKDKSLNENNVAMLLNRINDLTKKVDSHISSPPPTNLKLTQIIKPPTPINPKASSSPPPPPPPKLNSDSLVAVEIVDMTEISKKLQPLTLPEQPSISDTTYAMRSNFIIKPSSKYHHFSHLPTVGGISGQVAYDWAVNNVPFIDLPDLLEIEKVYYYRWKVYREHMVETKCIATPIVITECRFATTPPPLLAVDHQMKKLPIDGGEGCIWGDINGVIGAANGHHVSEGRWLRNDKIMDSYITYLFNYDILEGITPDVDCGNNTETGFTMDTKKPGRVQRRIYSEWLIFAMYNKYLLDGNIHFVQKFIPMLISDLAKFILKSRADLCRSKSCSKSSLNVRQCFWSSDMFDAMEGSVSGSGCRPSIHAIAYGETMALVYLLKEVAAVAVDEDQEEIGSKTSRSGGGGGGGERKGNHMSRNELIQKAEEYLKSAEEIRSTFIESYWNEKLQFFTTYKTVERCHLKEKEEPDMKSKQPQSTCEWYGTQFNCDERVDVRELIGLGPAWMHGLIQSTHLPKYEISWKFLLNQEKGFKGKYGLRTTEKSHICYNFTGTGRCEWNGPSWPYETSRVLTGLGELLQPFPSGYLIKPYTDEQRKLSGLTNFDFIDLLIQYTRQHMPSTSTKKAFHQSDPWNRHDYLLSENYHADEGYWIDRKVGYTPSRKRTGLFNHQGLRLDRNRGIDYLHSTYCDLVLSHLFGIRPQTSSLMIISPLLSNHHHVTLTRFAVDRLRLRGNEVAIVYDPKGKYYFEQSDHESDRDQKETTTPLCIGFCVFVNGKLSNSSHILEPLQISLPPPHH